MTQKEILEKLVEDLAEFNKDHLAMMTELKTPEEIARWRENRKLLNKVEDDFNNFLLIRVGKEPIF